MAFVSYLLVVLTMLMAIPVLIFVVEVFAALFLRPPRYSLNRGVETRESVAVLIPAHNESKGILPILEDVKPQLLSGDRLVVIADNCSDDTAAIAAVAGAAVIERHDPAKLGKGYALDFGLKRLSADPPAIVIFIDADCRLKEDSINLLTDLSAKKSRPAQALDLMTAPKGSPINYAVAEFAWRVKNWVRPLGLSALNLPCQLMGTGMAIPWEVVRSVDLASGSLVEDLRLGLDLALLGKSPLFCPAATVTSHFPSSPEGATSQRKRWEQGHLGLILTALPRLLYQGVALGNLDLLALALDLMVPPLSLLVILLGAAFLAAITAALFGCSLVPLTITVTCWVALAMSIFFAWTNYGRDILPPRKLLSIPSYVLAKLAIYSHFFSGRSVQKWTRTSRNKHQ